MLRGLRALYLQPAPLFGGAERQAACSASLLADFGVDVMPVVGPGRLVVDWLRERGAERFVHSRNFPGGWRKQKGLARLTLPWRYARCGLDAVAEIGQLVRQHAADVIVASLPFAWFTGSLVAQQSGIPIVWRAGGARINVAQAVTLWLVTRGLRPDLLVCTGDAVLRTFAPLVPAPARVIRNGVDPNVFHAGAGDPSRYRPKGARLVIGCAARLAAAKRPEDFILLAARLRARFPDVHFLLGGEGSARPDLERLARRLGADNLTFLGFVQDMPSFYAACDLVVLTSGAEGCPNFLLEAMAMNRPIVATDVAPVVELVKAGDEALIYPLGNTAALIDCVERLISSDELRRTLADRGRAVARRFTAHANAAELARTLAAVVAEHRSRSAQPRAGDPKPRVEGSPEV